ncbi:MAG TPA: branched-chain amino acid ABC transporter permease [Xanthobacteraceae bacterium]|jgi:branched-chain amino acid transport system permease protein|nr:branched-chain amino acid ABC transporter permease [Xanthobacteraceae bacterium]
MKSVVARVLVLGAFVAAPFVQTNHYWQHVFCVALIGVILALGMQLLLGMAGLLSLGQAAFYGIGAYVSAALTLHFGAPFLVAFILAGVAAAVCSLLLVPIVRLPGSSLAVATLGFNIIIYLVLLNEDWATGGSFGIMNVPAPRIFGFAFTGERAMYFLCLFVAVAVYLGMERLVNSRFGRALRAISQDEDAARASGISVNLYKSKCFLVAAFTAGLAGSLYAHQARYINPYDFSFNKSIEILIMVVVGGLGSMPGAVVGALIVVLTPEYLRSSGEWRLILFGALVVVLMGFSRGGVAGLVPVLGQQLMRLRPLRASKATTSGEPQ